MKKVTLLILVVLLVMTVLVTGCASSTPPASAPPTSAPETEQVIELKLAHQWPPQNVYGKTFQYYADLVDKKSNGKIKISIFPASSLIAVPNMYQGISQGTADIGYIGSSFLSPIMKELSFYEVPFVYDPNPEKLAQIEKETRPLLDQIFDKYGVKYLWAQDGCPTIFTSSKPIQKAGDLQNLKIRDYGVWVGKGLEKMGAVPTTISPEDINVALERKTVDGAYAAWTFADGYKLYEQAEYATWVPSQTMWVMLIMNQDSWQKLTPEQQNILMEAGAETQEYNIQLIKDRKAEYIKLAEAAGTTFYELSPEDVKQMQEQVKPVVEEVRGIIGPLGNELLDKLQSLQ